MISSHSWMGPDWSRRLYQLGGVTASYVGDGAGVIESSRSGAGLRAEFGRGLGLGSDFNGVGSHPAPRGAGTADPVTYPFTSVDGGSTVDRLVTGERTWDVDVDGGAHYGMLPDWIEELRRQGGDDQRTRWASRWSDDQWLTVDLRCTERVGQVVLDWEAAHARAYRIEVSADDATWRTVWHTTAGDGGLDDVRFAPTDARYVRIHGETRAIRYGYSLREVSIHGG